jgi:hypothetical protein
MWRLIRQFGEDQKIIAAETPLIAVLIEALEGHAMP